MNLRQTFTMIPAIAILAGCSSAPGTASAASATPSAATVSSTPLTTKLAPATINDPSLGNMQAEILTIPSGWKMQGIIITSPCTTLPWPVFRAYSSDGLTQMRYEPVVAWQWHPNLRMANNNNGCLPLTQPLTAAQFLQYYTGTISGGVHVVGTMSIAPQYQQWANQFAAVQNQGNSRMAPALQTNHTADSAALRIETVNGSFVVEERLRVAVECGINSNPGPMNGGTCWARVDVLTAPQGKLDALAQLVDNNNLPHATPIPQWSQAVFQRQAQQSAAAMAALTAQERQESQMLYQQYQQFRNTMNQNHAAFMQQQESQFQSAMNNANASMNAQSTAASDWVDYALDQQTVAGPGGTAKVSSAYSQTWTNGTQWYQTNDPNANPNGALSGSWTLTTQVHGNGQPK
jgi:hypothetical protein